MNPTVLNPTIVSDARSIAAWGVFFSSYFVMAALGAAALLITRTTEPRLVYDEVDWGLLVFFVGLFIIAGGAERAGLTESLLQPFVAWNLHRIWIFSVLTALVSNIVSNVPAVVLLKPLTVLTLTWGIIWLSLVR